MKHCSFPNQNPVRHFCPSSNLHCPTTHSTMLQLKKYKCGDCGYSCYLKTDLERHITNVHEKVCKIGSRPFDGSKFDGSNEF